MRAPDFPPVRAALAEDREHLFDLLMALAEDNNSFGEIDNKRVREHILSSTTPDGGGICGIVRASPVLIAGATNIVWDRWFFAKRYHLNQTFFFVRKEFRASRIANDLMKWSKGVRQMVELGEGHPIQLITSVASEKDLDRKARWWRRHCGEAIGMVYSIK
jgi:hypothetical protein